MVGSLPVSTAPGIARGTTGRLWSAWILGVVVLAWVLRVAEIEAVRSWLDRLLVLAQG